MDLMAYYSPVPTDVVGLAEDDAALMARLVKQWQAKRPERTAPPVPGHAGECRLPGRLRAPLHAGPTGYRVRLAG